MAKSKEEKEKEIEKEEEKKPENIINKSGSIKVD